MGSKWLPLPSPAPPPHYLFFSLLQPFSPTSSPSSSLSLLYLSLSSLAPLPLQRPSTKLSSLPPTSGPPVRSSTWTTGRRPCNKSLVEARPHWSDSWSPPGLAITQTPSEHEIKASGSGKDIKRGRNNGETFQRQAFLTFVQTPGMFCFEKNLIHTMGLGLRNRLHQRQ